MREAPGANEGKRLQIVHECRKLKKQRMVYWQHDYRKIWIWQCLWYKCGVALLHNILLILYIYVCTSSSVFKMPLWHDRGYGLAGLPELECPPFYVTVGVLSAIPQIYCLLLFYYQRNFLCHRKEYSKTFFWQYTNIILLRKTLETLDLYTAIDMPYYFNSRGKYNKKLILWPSHFNGMKVGIYPVLDCPSNWSHPGRPVLIVM